MTVRRRLPRFGVATILLALALLSIPSRADALEDHERNGWVAGIGFGFGRAKFQ